MKQREKKCLLCPNQAFSRNLCKLCYAKAKQHGELDKYNRVQPPLSIESRTKKEGDCLVWTGDRVSGKWAYGVITFGNGKNRTRIRAHRWVYEQLVGPIPEGKILMHTCDNPPCVNIAHLRIGTIAENNADTSNKRRHHYGLEHWNGRLSDSDVEAIKASREVQGVLAKRYGVTQSHICHIKKGRHRK